MKKVLFICVHNSGRSQMAEALFNYHAKGEALAYSAGTRPACHKDKNVVVVMKEKGLDISKQHPKMLTPEMMEGVDRVITMGCGVENICPATWVSTEDWGLGDPEGEPLQKVREIRDEIEAKVKALIEKLQ